MVFPGAASAEGGAAARHAELRMVMPDHEAPNLNSPMLQRLTPRCGGLLRDKGIAGQCAASRRSLRLQHAMQSQACGVQA